MMGRELVISLGFRRRAGVANVSCRYLRWLIGACVMCRIWVDMIRDFVDSARNECELLAGVWTGNRLGVDTMSRIDFRMWYGRVAIRVNSVGMAGGLMDACAGLGCSGRVGEAGRLSRRGRFHGWEVLQLICGGHQSEG